jgi:four helix bundle protein
MEANAASSKKDFKNKIHICKKEAQESKYWLHMISIACSECTKDARMLWKETQELTLIFGKIISTLRG